MKKNVHLIIWPALIIIFLDQATKLAVVRSLRVYESVPIVSGFFNLVHVRNRGMAFGLMSGGEWDWSFYFLTIATFAALIVIFIWLLRLKENEGRVALGLSLVSGGAIGNLIDRIRFKEVIDFLDFYLGSFHWPAFNLADSSITVGTFWIAICLYFKNTKRD